MKVLFFFDSSIVELFVGQTIRYFCELFLLKELRIYELLFCERIVDGWIVAKPLDVAFPECRP